MRPKYSSPGADSLNSSHWICAHLLFVAPQASLTPLVGGCGGCGGLRRGRAAAAVEAGDSVVSNAIELAAATAMENIDSVSFIGRYFSRARAYGLPERANEGHPATSRTSRHDVAPSASLPLQLRARDRGDFPGAFESVLDTRRSRGAQRRPGRACRKVRFPAYVLGNEPLDARQIDDALERTCANCREPPKPLSSRVRRRGATASSVTARVVIDADGSPCRPRRQALPLALRPALVRRRQTGSHRFATSAGLARRARLRRRTPSDDFARARRRRRRAAGDADRLGHERARSERSGERASRSARARARLREPRSVRCSQQVRQRARHGRLLRQEPNHRRRAARSSRLRASASPKR